MPSPSKEICLDCSREWVLVNGGFFKELYEHLGSFHCPALKQWQTLNIFVRRRTIPSGCLRELELTVMQEGKRQGWDKTNDKAEQKNCKQRKVKTK